MRNNYFNIMDQGPLTSQEHFEKDDNFLLLVVGLVQPFLKNGYSL